jgi:hypothetical protein
MEDGESGVLAILQTCKLATVKDVGERRRLQSRSGETSLAITWRWFGDSRQSSPFKGYIYRNVGPSKYIGIALQGPIYIFVNPVGTDNSISEFFVTKFVPADLRNHPKRIAEDSGVPRMVLKR